MIGLLPNSPARDSGLLGGDRILRVDGNDLAGLSQAAVEDLLDDPAESPAMLTVLRADGREELVRCPRGRFAVETVQGLSRDPGGEWIYSLPGDGGLAYVRISEVLPSPPARLRETLPHLGPLRAILLDLRGNPGGDLQAAVELANLFLREGPTDRAAVPALRAVEDEVRLVILVNEKTASAAEMIAAALAFRDRAVLVGRRTVGKGCVQSMILLDGGLGRLNLTTAEFFVDPLRPIQRRKDSNSWGVEPHVLVTVPAALEANLAAWREQTEVLRLPRPATAPATAGVREEDPGAALLALDPQLKRAVALASNPAAMNDLLRRAAEARAAAAKPVAPTQTAPPGARTRPAGAGSFPFP